MRIEEEIQQKEFQDAYHKLSINLMYTVNWLRDLNKSLFKPYGITSQQYNVLRILRGAYPDVKSAGEIKKVMLDKSPDLTRLMDRLVSKKLVERELCSENRRKMDIRITSKGLDILKEIDRVMEKHMEKFKTISEKEANLASDILDKLRG